MRVFTAYDQLTIPERFPAQEARNGPLLDRDLLAIKGIAVPAMRHRIEIGQFLFRIRDAMKPERLLVPTQKIARRIHDDEPVGCAVENEAKPALAFTKRLF